MIVVREEDVVAPFHLPSQQTQVDPAHQVHLEPPGGHGPQ